jgi:hypothetical protein
MGVRNEGLTMREMAYARNISARSKRNPVARAVRAIRPKIKPSGKLYRRSRSYAT